MNIRSLIADALLWCLLCALLASGFSNAGVIGRYSSVSLRFDAPVSGRTAYMARQYSIEHSGEDVFWPTFWREDSAEFSSGYVTASADCIVFSGDAMLVWPTEYLVGTTPGVTDGTGCAVSSALAWTLWGAIDVVGMTVDVDGEERVVRGVFEGGVELALLSIRDEDTSQSFTATELSGGPPDATRDDAEGYAAASGLGKPSTVLMGGPAFLAGALAALPLILLTVYGLALVTGSLVKRYLILKRLLPFILLICFAAGLPGLLGMLPAWLIPSRWSDFSFWASLTRQAVDGLREFLWTVPCLRDVDLRFLLLKQSGIALLSVCCALSVCFRWQMRRGRNAKVIARDIAGG